MKLKVKRLIFTIIVLLIVIFSVFYFTNKNKNSIYKFDVETYNIPGERYEGSINRSNGKVKMKVTSYCSAVDCDSTINNYEGVLSKTELKNVNKVIDSNNKTYIIFMYSAIENILKGDKPYESGMTYKNFGDLFLESIIKELK